MTHGEESIKTRKCLTKMMNLIPCVSINDQGLLLESRNELPVHETVNLGFGFHLVHVIILKLVQNVIKKLEYA